MSTAARRVETVAKPVTIAEFDAFVDTQNDDTKYELVDGVIVMMTNPTGTHGRIVGNIGGRLLLAMDARGCNTYVGGMRVQRSENVDDTDKTIPDIVVHCSPVSSLTYITDPIVVVEVLSPSTMDIDRGFKRIFYQSLPTLRHIAFVYQRQMRVEHYRWDGHGWPVEELSKPEDLLEFDAVAFRIDLAHIYSAVPL